jgi:hypothetical protein
MMITRGPFKTAPFPYWLFTSFYFLITTTPSSLNKVSTDVRTVSITSFEKNQNTTLITTTDSPFNRVSTDARTTVSITFFETISTTNLHNKCQKH